MSTGGRVWLVTVMCVAVALVMAMVSTITMALPDLARDTGASQTEQTWIVDAYTVALAALLLPAGALGDRYGRRGLLVLGMLVFAAGCAAPFVRDSVAALIASRAVTGVGAALIMPATLSVIAASFPERARGGAVSLWAASAGLGGFAGLLGAGLLLEHHSWRSTFAAPALLAVALAVAAMTLPNSREKDPPALDPAGAVLGALSVGAAVVGIIQAAHDGWGSATVLGLLAASVLAAVAFCVVESRSARPLLDVRLFLDHGFGTGSLSIVLQLLVTFGLAYVIVQYLQFVHGESPLESGLALAPIGVVLPVALVANRVAARIGLRAVTTLGLLAASGSMVVLAQLEPTSGYGLLAVGLVLLGTGLGLAAPPATAAILNRAPRGKYGVASAVNDAARELGAALGIALAGSLVSSRYSAEVAAALERVPEEAREPARDSAAAALQIAPRLGPEGAGLAEAARSAFTEAMSASLLGLAAVAAAGALGLACWRPARPGVRDDRDRDRELVGG